MRKFAVLLALALAIPAVPDLVLPTAAQYCEGTVHELSRRYNPATGSGFLAVRAGPKKSASQVGELFNGDKVEIFDRRGNWYKVAAVDGSSAGCIRNDCNY